MTAEDLPFLLRVYASTREEELAPVPWTAEQKDAFLRQQFEAQHAWWQENYTGATFDVIEVGGDPAGRFYVHRGPRAIRVVDIALLAAHRGSGIGARLLRELFAEGDGAGKPVSVHVEKFNRARTLYDRLGFREVEDKGVYLLMERPVGG
jgi:GNAT superfamily N-acetyltransferase